MNKTLTTEQLRELLALESDDCNEDNPHTQTSKERTSHFNSDNLINDYFFEKNAIARQEMLLPHLNNNDDDNITKAENSPTGGQEPIILLEDFMAGNQYAIVGVNPNETVNYDQGDVDLLDKLNIINTENSEYLYPLFKKFNIKHFQIKYLKDFHIQHIIPMDQMGIMAEFQHKLELWKQSEANSVDIVINENIFRNANTSLLEIISSNQNLTSKVQKSSLTDKESKCLLTMVKDHFVNCCGNQMRSSDMERISKEIEASFPGEVCDTYFKRCLKKQKDGRFKTKLTGQLVSKWTNRSDKEGAMKKKLLEEGNFHKTEVITIGTIENEDDQKRIQAALKNTGTKPLTLILKDWTMCREIRLKCLLENKNNPRNVTQEWPLYLCPDGNLLVSLIILSTD